MESPRGIKQVLSSYTLIHLISSIIIGVTQGSSLLLRVVAFAIILALAISLQHIVAGSSWDGYRPLAAPLSLFTWMNTFSALDLFFYSRVTYAEHLNWLRSKNKDHVQSSPSSHIIWALSMPMNYRRIGTKWQVTQSHAVSSDTTTKATSGSFNTPARTSFILYRLLATINCYICIFFLVGRAAEDFLPVLSANDVLNEWKLSPTTLPSRIYLFASFIIGIHTAQKAHYNTLSILAVLAGFSNPSDWPPFQGPYAGTYSVRRLWGHTWHQSFRAFVSANADFVTFTCLRLRPRSLTARYARFFISFAISGLIHIFFDEACGIPQRESHAFFFFTIQPVAFAVEELAQTICRRYGILMKEADKEVRAIIGYIWVAGWGTLTWPVWFFPAIRNGQLVHFLHLPGSVC